MQPVETGDWIHWYKEFHGPTFSPKQVTASGSEAVEMWMPAVSYFTYDPGWELLCIIQAKALNFSKLVYT